jgi:hypothetical protein
MLTTEILRAGQQLGGTGITEAPSVDFLPNS